MCGQNLTALRSSLPCCLSCVSRRCVTSHYLSSGVCHPSTEAVFLFWSTWHTTPHSEFGEAELSETPERRSYTAVTKVKRGDEKCMEFSSGLASRSTITLIWRRTGQTICAYTKPPGPAPCCSQTRSATYRKCSCQANTWLLTK